MYRTGQTIELHTPAHPYYDEQCGFTDHNCIIPENTDRLTIKRVTQRKDGDTLLTLRRADNTGYGIILNKWLSFKGWGRTIKIV